MLGVQATFANGHFPLHSSQSDVRVDQLANLKQTVSKRPIYGGTGAVAWDKKAEVDLFVSEAIVQQWVFQ